MFYKIRNNSNGTYSRGGMSVDFAYGWSRTGKIWSSKNALILHLRQLKKPEIIYADCTLIQIDETGATSVVEVSFVKWYEEYLATKKQKEEKPTKFVPKLKVGDPVVTNDGIFGVVQTRRKDISEDSWLILTLKNHYAVYQEKDLKLLIPKV